MCFISCRYSLDGPCNAVVLDSSAMNANVIIFLDTYFHVVVWLGANIKAWHEQGVQNQPGYEYFAQLLKAPLADAKVRMESRFPRPMLIETVSGGSQERFLTAKVNHSGGSGDNTEGGGGGNGGDVSIFSEDVSYKVFMQHLKKLVVQT